MSQKPRFSSIKISGDFSVVTKKKQQINCKQISQEWQKYDLLSPRGGMCDPMVNVLNIQCHDLTFCYLIRSCSCMMAILVRSKPLH